MHPLNYEVTLRTIQLDIDRTTREAQRYADFMPSPVRNGDAPRRDASLMRRILNAFAPSKTQQATAE